MWSPRPLGWVRIVQVEDVGPVLGVVGGCCRSPLYVCVCRSGVRFAGFFPFIVDVVIGVWHTAWRTDYTSSARRGSGVVNPLDGDVGGVTMV